MLDTFMLIGEITLAASIVASLMIPRLRNKIVGTILLVPKAQGWEKAALVSALLLLLVGPALIGPLDEILALGVIAKITKRIIEREQAIIYE